jgi:hypothetical protein
LSSELNNIIRNKEEMLTNVKDLLNRHTDELELTVKKLEDTNAQFIKCTEETKDMAEKKMPSRNNWKTLRK